MPEPFNLTVTWKESGEQETIEFQMPGLHGKRPRGKKRLQMLYKFSLFIHKINESINFAVSGRGWCYMLEQYNFITKGDFAKTQSCINECRKLGFLPIDFVAEEIARSFGGIEDPTEKDPINYMLDRLKSVEETAFYYDPDWWDGEEYYLMMVVEKVDLVTLFTPICREYHIPIANSRGWSSILQRNDIVKLAQKAEEQGLTPVLLYCGDHDPHGLAISDLLRKNIQDLYKATKYWGENLTIDRFGLNHEFIEEAGLSWIENLETGSGKQADRNHPIVADYIDKYGERKCEANALVINPTAGRDLCRRAIEGYLGDGALDRFRKKKQEVEDKIDDFLYNTDVGDLIEQIEQVQTPGDLFDQIRTLADEFNEENPWREEEE